MTSDSCQTTSPPKNVAQPENNAVILILLLSISDLVDHYPMLPLPLLITKFQVSLNGLKVFLSN